MFQSSPNPNPNGYLVRFGWDVKKKSKGGVNDPPLNIEKSFLYIVKQLGCYNTTIGFVITLFR